MAVYTGLYSSTICLLAIQSIYRYWALFDTPKLEYFNGIYYFIWVGYYTFFGILWSLTVGYFFAMDEFSMEYLSKEISLRYERNITDTPILDLIAYQGNDFRWKNLTGALMMTDISTFQYTIIIVCGYNMYHGMQTKLSLLSAQHRRLHRQFFRALTIQVMM